MTFGVIDTVFDSNAGPGGYLLGVLPAGKPAAFVLVDVVTPFDGDASITVGDVVAQGRLFAAEDADLSYVSGYLTTPNTEYEDDTVIRIYLSGNPTQGAGRVRVFYY